MIKEKSFLTTFWDFVKHMGFRVIMAEAINLFQIQNAERMNRTLVAV